MRWLWYIALIGSALARPAAAQSVADTVKKIGGEWRACVESQIALAPASLEDWVGPAEKAFQYCLTEEQHYIAAVNLGAPTDSAAKQILFSHYRDKAAWKKKITDDFFSAMVKNLQKK